MKDGEKISLGILVIGGLAGVILLAMAKPAMAKPIRRRPPCGSYGDVDGDGWVTQRDAILVADYIVGKVELTEEQLGRADVDGDGVITSVDAMFIGQYVSGLRDSFPICEEE